MRVYVVISHSQLEGVAVEGVFKDFVDAIRCQEDCHGVIKESEVK